MTARILTQGPRQNCRPTVLHRHQPLVLARYTKVVEHEQREVPFAGGALAPLEEGEEGGYELTVGVAGEADAVSFVEGVVFGGGEEVAECEGRGCGEGLVAGG